MKHAGERSVAERILLLTSTIVVLIALKRWLGITGEIVDVVSVGLGIIAFFLNSSKNRRADSPLSGSANFSKGSADQLGKGDSLE